jgi:hypothetical protein
MGKRIKVKMAPVSTQLTGFFFFSERGCCMDVDGELVALDWRQVDKANLVYEFNP